MSESIADRRYARSANPPLIGMCGRVSGRDGVELAAAICRRAGARDSHPAGAVPAKDQRPVGGPITVPTAYAAREVAATPVSTLPCADDRPCALLRDVS